MKPLLIATALLALPALGLADHRDDGRQYVVDVRAASHELDEATRHAYQAARRDASRVPWHRGVLRPLDALADQAHAFRKRAERERNPFSTRAADEFRDLNRAYCRAAWSLQHRPNSEHVDDDFDRVDRLMGVLSGFYGEPGCRIAAFNRDREDDWRHR